MVGHQLTHELEINVPARQAWELFSTLRLAKLVEEEFKDFFQKIEVLEGDGGPGTLVKLYFVPGIPGVTNYTEKFTKIDNENMVKVAEVIEGGYLDLGFKYYRVQFEVIEKGSDSCITKTLVEYDVIDEAANPNYASLVSLEPLIKILNIAKLHLTKS